MADDMDLPPPGPGTNRDEPRDTAPPVKAKSETGLDRYNRERREKKEKRTRDQEIIREAVKRYKRCVEAEAENRKEALEDLKFKAGKQWPSDVETQRAIDKRPCLTINGLPTFTHQIANDIRQNRPSINLSPLGSESTKESAELFSSLIRGIERDSAADIAYDTAVGSAIDIGFGYWRVLLDWESPESMNQVIVVARVRNSFTVHLDPGRQQPDGSDSKFGFVSELMDRKDFRDEYPKAIELDWNEKGQGEAMKEWVSKDQIRVAEYYRIVYEKKRLVHLDNGHLGWYDDLDESLKAKIKDGTAKILEERLSEIPKVEWFKLTGAEILEENEWVGKWIPIVEVIGDEIDIEGKVVRSGVIRNAKDPMRMKNYWATAKAEVVALAPKSPWVMAEGQDEGYEAEWSQAHSKPIVVLHYVPVKADGGMLVPPPTRQAPPQVASGIVEAEKSSEQDLMRTTGVRFDATMQERMYDESGKAVHEIRRTGDLGSFHYSDNFARSLRHFGRILVDLIPKVMETERFMSAIGEDGTDSRIKIDPNMGKPVGRIANPLAANESQQPQQQQNPMLTPGMGGGMPGMPAAKPGGMMEPMKVFNPRKGSYGIAVTTGPSYATRRIEAQEQMAGFIGKVPEQMRGVVAALMAKYSDWPGSTELFKALSKMLPAGVLMPDNKDLPPAVAAFVASMTKQIQQLMTERMQLLRELSSKRVDQDIAKSKVEKDFEAKLLKLVADSQKHMDKMGTQAIDSTLSAHEQVHGMLMGEASKEAAQKEAAAREQQQQQGAQGAQPKV